MSDRNPDYLFINESADSIITELTSKYQEITGVTVYPASPVRVFLSWVASAILQIYQNINYVANQNIPSRAVGANLDALAELYFMRTRPTATPAYVTMEFTISAAQGTTIIIPAGTRVTTVQRERVFETTEEASIAIGDTSVQVLAVCQDAGEIGNGFTAGQLCECIDLFTYYESCENVDTSSGGSDAPTDDEFYDLLVNSMDAFSCAGPIGAYKYYAKSVSLDIADVVVNSPDDGEVAIYALMNDGTKASSTIKALIAAACNDENVRPLTDSVSVEDPDEVTYNITLTYYMSNDSQKSAAEITADVNTAVAEFQAWQSGKLGRDINPSKLIQMILNAGAKRVNLTYPAYAALSDGSDGSAPELAKVGTVSVTNGGYEDE